jgi:thioredoxin 1
MAVITLTKENYETEVIQSDKPVLIDFWAGWCGPCQMLSPVVGELAEERSDIKVAKLNVDDAELADIVMGFRVMSIPMLVVIKNGEETNRSIGVISKEEILALL